MLDLTPIQPPPRRRRGSFWRGLVIVIVVFIVGRGPVQAMLEHKTKAALQREVRALPARRIVVALFAKDASGNRADVNALLILDPAARRAIALIFPRDAEWRRPDGKIARVNSAWRYGPKTAMAALRQLSGFEPEGYVAISMSQAERLVDLLGGIDVEIPKAIRHTDHAAGESWMFQPGTVHLTGEQAVQLFRERHSFADGSDVRGRIPNQKRVAAAILARLNRLTELELLRIAQRSGKIESSIPMYEGKHGQVTLLRVAWALHEREALSFQVMPWLYSSHGRVRVDASRLPALRGAFRSFLAGGPEPAQPGDEETPPRSPGTVVRRRKPGSVSHVRVPTAASEAVRKKAAYLARNLGIPVIGDGSARSIEIINENEERK